MHGAMHIYARDNSHWRSLSLLEVYWSADVVVVAKDFLFGRKTETHARQRNFFREVRACIRVRQLYASYSAPDANCVWKRRFYKTPIGTSIFYTDNWFSSSRFMIRWNNFFIMFPHYRCFFFTNGHCIEIQNILFISFSLENILIRGLKYLYQSTN